MGRPSLARRSGLGVFVIRGYGKNRQLLGIDSVEAETPVFRSPTIHFGGIDRRRCRRRQQPQKNPEWYTPERRPALTIIFKTTRALRKSRSTPIGHCSLLENWPRRLPPQTHTASAMPPPVGFPTYPRPDGPSPDLRGELLGGLARGGRGANRMNFRDTIDFGKPQASNTNAWRGTQSRRLFQSADDAARRISPKSLDVVARSINDQSIRRRGFASFLGTKKKAL